MLCLSNFFLFFKENAYHAHSRCLRHLSNDWPCKWGNWAINIYRVD